MNQPIILYTRFCRFVGREIARLLDIYGYYNPPPNVVKKASKIIRWGYYESLNTSAPQINTRDAIRNASGKFGALQKLRAANISVPEFSTAWAFPSKGIVVGRSYTHTGGTDIEIVQSEKKPKQHHDYFTAYIKPHREWRVHVFGGKMLYAQKKFFQEGTPEGIQQFVRSYNNGWRFHRLKDITNLPSNVKNAAIRAVNALGLTFGAVDVISHGRDSKGNRKATVLEVNTAPGLDDGYGMDCYVESFKKWLKL